MIIFNKKQRGSALLYTLVLIGSLMLVGALAFSYIVFSLNSRRESYNSQVNYWLAWGGIEASLLKIRDYQIPAGTINQAFFDWPVNNLIEKDPVDFVTLKADTDNIYSLAPVVLSNGYFSQVSVAYFTKLNPLEFSLVRDESKIFDLSKFSGSLSVSFYPYRNNEDLNVENNLVWLRLENLNSPGREILEAVVQSNADGTAMKLPQSTPGFPNINLGSCSAMGSDPSRGDGFMGQKCTFTINFTSSTYRFFKVKIFKADMDLNFNFNTNDSALGMPETVIRAAGQINNNTKDRKELFLKFPNQLKSISDVLDYSIYQAEF